MVPSYLHFVLSSLGGAVARVWYCKLLLLITGCQQLGRSNLNKLKFDASFHPSKTPVKHKTSKIIFSWKPHHSLVKDSGEASLLSLTILMYIHVSGWFHLSFPTGLHHNGVVDYSSSDSILCISYLSISHPYTIVNADTCAREWLQYQGNCYGYFEAEKTWEEAEIECQSYHRGTHLASILTLAETLVVANHIVSYQTKPSNVWIGLHDIRHNGKWRWSDESTYNYKAWMLGKPNLRTKEYCVELVRPVHGANVSKESYHQYEAAPITDHKDFIKWNNTACHKRNAYICKHAL
ncbi:regenerating islet-derived protein 4-like [Erythrolamprus reginae]|uniref:regenerating islet-derived protein 4-like n=1 Tax=Erythrolamprus reginae TaxID=121349 RepID=UPI00396CABEB